MLYQVTLSGDLTQPLLIVGDSVEHSSHPLQLSHLHHDHEQLVGVVPCLGLVVSYERLIGALLGLLAEKETSHEVVVKELLV